MLRAFALVLWLVWGALAQAQGVLPVPALSARVIDQTATLDPVQRQGLEDKLAAFEREKGSQIVMLLVPTTAPEDIASYANRVANEWKIGRRDVGDGVLLIVAKNDRRVRIEVAKTLEGAIPDLAAKRVIDDAITPAFRRGDFAGGLQAAADQLMARIRGEALPEVWTETEREIVGDSGDAGFDWGDLAIFLFVAVTIASTLLHRLLGKKLGLLATGGGTGLVAWAVTSSLLVALVAAVLALLYAVFLANASLASRQTRGGRYGPWISTGGWHHGGGGGGWGGRGGGGFSSGGGGNFGGGGASGSW